MIPIPNREFLPMFLQMNKYPYLFLLTGRVTLDENINESDRYGCMMDRDLFSTKLN